MFNKYELQALHELIKESGKTFIMEGIDCDVVDLKNLDKKIRIEIKKIEVQEIRDEE